MAEFFSHDYHARHDPKLQHVQEKYSMNGIGIYWCLVEFCYEQGGRILDDECERIAFDLRTQCDTIRSILRDFELFDFDGTQYTSKSITRRLIERAEKSQKAANSANFRWNNANALRTQCDRNAIKDSKGKEKKEKNTEEPNPASRLVASLSSKFTIPEQADPKKSFKMDGQYVPWSFYQRVVNHFKGDHHQARLVFYRAHAAGAKDVVAWVTQGFKGEERYALQACKDEYDSKGSVTAWIKEQFEK